jgi:DEAD/DEAH box helicase domain-containing protein
MNPILLARHIEAGLTDLVRSTLNTTSPAFEGVVDRFLSEPHNFIKGPWVSADMPFKQIEGAKEGWEQPFPEVPLKFAPYQHQMSAFERLGGTDKRSTLVATGTGSGKTESYLWPILDHCRQHKGEPGIKAILIYPMNALATDQARRIADAITSIPALEGVRAGIYADAEPSNAATEVTPDSVITHRDTIRQNPPDILLTNYKMLDYLLLRARDKALWEKNTPETLRFLVVDEMHTFDGAQGADLALLLRRLKSRLDVPQDHLVCVGSSATLGTGEDAIKDLRTYAETIFGEAFDEDAVIRETRLEPEAVFPTPEYFEWPKPEDVAEALEAAEDMDQAEAARRLAFCLFPDERDPDLAELHAGDPSSSDWRIRLGQLLVEHHICQRILTIIHNHAGPASLSDIAEALGQAKALRHWDPASTRELAELVVSLVAWARSGDPAHPRPLFNVRLQTWIREMARMVVDLPRTLEGGERSAITLHHGADLDKAELRSMLPMVNCNRCGASAHVGRQSSKGMSYWAALDQIYEEFFDDRGGEKIRLFYHESIDRTVKAASGGKRIVSGLLDAQSLEFQPGDHDDLEPGPQSPVWMYDPTDDHGRIDRTCPACGQSQGLILFGMRAARMTTGITGTLYTSKQNEDEPTAKPRFLMFSDSVQDAAHRAAVAETRNARTVSQKSLYQALQANPARSELLSAVIKDVPERYLDEMGGDDFTAQFIAKEQTWRKDYQALIHSGTSITDARFLDQMAMRLGWEYFADLTYRSHLPHTLEANGFGIADVSAARLTDSAEKLAHGIRNEFPSSDPIDAEALVPFLAGLLQRMRRQGSVDHPYVAASIATNTRDKGLNYFGGARQLGVGGSQTLPPLNHRRGLAPIPITLQRSLVGFEGITRDHSGNWYRDWLFRCLAPLDLAIASDPSTVLPLVLRRLEADGLLRRVERPDGLDGHGYLIDRDTIDVSLDVAHLACGRCGRRDRVLSGNVEALEGSNCQRMGCDGKLTQIAPAQVAATERALQSDRNHRVVAREHTGLLETDARLRTEVGFIEEETRWAPNLISATPTLEMGIDIGDLSTLLLCSVPPEEANYVQRMGRTGRRDGNALNLVLANARAHDLQFWEDPKPMLAGEVKAPGVYIAAEAVLLRQIAAFTLDEYVASTPAAGDYGKVRDVLARRAKGSLIGFPFDWLEMVEVRASELADRFIKILPQAVQDRSDLTERLNAYLCERGEHSLSWQVLSAFDAAEGERVRLKAKRDEVTKEQRRLQRRKEEYEKDKYDKLQAELDRDKKAINRLIRSGIEDASVLKFLTDKGLLPNYAFPEEGVKLTSILARRESPADDDGLLYLEYSRSASSALSEFAPGQTFYADGRQVKIDRLDLSPDDISEWRFCQNCSYASDKLADDPSDACPKCGDEMWSDSGSRHEVVDLKSVLAISSEDKAAIKDGDQRQQQLFDRGMIPSYGPSDIVSAWFSNGSEGAPFGFEFITDCRFHDINYGRQSNAPSGPQIAGEKRQSYPFQLCRKCGAVQSGPLEPDAKGEHAPNCAVPADEEARQSDWLVKAFLMRKFNTEAIRIVMPVSGEADENDIKSFVAGINLGMRQVFAGKVDHIRPAVVKTQLDGMATVRSLFLYDSVPGGSGYLRQIGEHPETLRQIIERAIVKLRDCPCAKEDKSGCYRCIKSYRSQFGPGEPERDRALGLMEAMLKQWESLSKASDSIDTSIRSSLVETELEQRFLAALERTFGPESLRAQVLPGGARGFVINAGTDESPKLWGIETQVQVDERYRGLPRKRVDFLLQPIGRSDVKPIIVETDGLEYHADTIAKDVTDRFEMIRSGQVRVWTLLWQDLASEADPEFSNPLKPSAVGAEAEGRLGRVLTTPDFETLSTETDRIRHQSGFDSLVTALRRKDGECEQAVSVLARTITGLNSKFASPGPFEALNDDTKLHLEAGECRADITEGGLTLLLSSDKLRPNEWASAISDLRVVLAVDLAAGPVNQAQRERTRSILRGFWRLTNLLQNLPGLHVDIPGLDTLLSPNQAADPPSADENWILAKELCEEGFHPLLDAIHAAGLPAPDRLGDDVIENGRVTGMIEFGWSSHSLAVCESELASPVDDVVVFLPGSSSITETVSVLIKKMGKVEA